MEWKSPFIIYRVSSDGKFQEVYHANDLKQAKYWLTYIAEPMDVLCKTPAHPRSEAKMPEYWSHKEQSGKAAMNKKDWEEKIKENKSEICFPEEQILPPGSLA
ncbi:MAG: hypothetical protein KDD56_02205 [Bdellovibrionales bacterium]|nr:hypothetical protein [Bdellovibrionales bacterium]